MTQSSDMAVIKEQMARLLRLVEGNGKMGLVDKANHNSTRIDGLTSSLDIHLEDHKKMHEQNSLAEKERKEFWNKVSFAVITLIITNVGTIVFDIIRASMVK